MKVQLKLKEETKGFWKYVGCQKKIPQIPEFTTVYVAKADYATAPRVTIVVDEEVK